MNVYKNLVFGGGFALPVLAHFSSGNTNIYLVNDNIDRTFEGNTYIASNFTYSTQSDGGATLNVELVHAGNMLINLFENTRNFNVEFTGIMAKTGEVEKIEKQKFKFAKAKWTGKSAEITFDKDDRLDMTFPVMVRVF